MFYMTTVQVLVFTRELDLNPSNLFQPLVGLSSFILNSNVILLLEPHKV